MRRFWILLLLAISSLLQAQSFEEWMNLGKGYMVEREYQKALICFEEAQSIQPQNPLPDQYIELIHKFIEMNEIDSSKEADLFIQEQEIKKQNNREEDPVEENSDIQNDFIYQQEQKDRAIRDRTSGTFLFSIPMVGSIPFGSSPIYSANETSFFPNGYGIEASFFPDFLNNTLGLGIQVEEKIISNDIQRIRLNQYNLNLSIRNFFKEEVGAHFLLGTRIGGGINIINGFSDGIAGIVAWQASLFFSEPFLYHLSRDPDTKPMLAVGNISIRYGENYYVLEGDLGLVYQLNRFDIGLSLDYVYQFQYSEDVYSPWTFSLVLGKNL